MSLKRFGGIMLYILSLCGVCGFDYSFYLAMRIGTCASGPTPYAIATHCPSGTGTVVAIMLASIAVALVCAYGAVLLGGMLNGALLFTALFLPMGLGFAMVGYEKANVRVVFYGVAALFAVLSIAPLMAARPKQS